MSPELVLVAFMGVFSGHFFWLLCEQSSIAVTRSRSISSFLAHRVRVLLAPYFMRIALPLIFLATCLFLESREVGTLTTRSEVFGFLLIVGVLWRDVYPKANVIPLSWGVIYGCVFAGIGRANGFPNLEHDQNLSFEFLKLCIQGVVVVGTVLGVCMTILWTMDRKNLQGVGSHVKNESDPQQINYYRGFCALYMLALFAFIFIGVYHWLALPLMQSLSV